MPYRIETWIVRAQDETVVRKPKQTMINKTK